MITNLASCKKTNCIQDDSALAPVISVSFRRGVTLRKDYPYLSTSDNGVTFSVIDLTGYTGIMEVKLDINDATPELTLTTENGGMSIYQQLFVDKLGNEYPEAWTVEFVISDSTTAAIEWTKAYGFIQLIAPNNDIEDFLTVILIPIGKVNEQSSCC